MYRCDFVETDHLMYSAVAASNDSGKKSKSAPKTTDADQKPAK